MSSTRGGAASKTYSERELRRVTVGPLQPLNGPVALVPYDPRWPDRFMAEASRIREVLGERALRIEHVGSTSVPGLLAKPVIDILLVVADSSDEPSYVPKLEAAGYVLRIREPDWKQHRLFHAPDRGVGVHVFSQGSDEIERMLDFRDRLRENQADFELYASTKSDLARRKWRYRQNYADAKSEVVEAILARSRARKSERSTRRPAPRG